MNHSHLTALFASAFFASALSSPAQQPIAVGKGSNASAPPAGLIMDKKRNVDVADEVEKRQLFLVKDDGRAILIPSNKWSQNLLFKQFGTGLWAIPHKVDATAKGIGNFLPNSFSGDGVRTIAELPLNITGNGAQESTHKVAYKRRRAAISGPW